MKPTLSPTPTINEEINLELFRTLSSNHTAHERLALVSPVSPQLIIARTAHQLDHVPLVKFMQNKNKLERPLFLFLFACGKTSGSCCRNFKSSIFSDLPFS